MTAGNGAGFVASPFSFPFPVTIPPLLSTVMSLPAAVYSNALQEMLLWVYCLYTESECTYFSQYCNNGTKLNVICFVNKWGQERYQIASWYLFLASDSFSVNLIHIARLIIHYVFYILFVLKLFVSPCYQTFWYSKSSFWMSPALNPAVWPICAFGSCNINGRSHFSYSLTQYIQS